MTASERIREAREARSLRETRPKVYRHCVYCGAVEHPLNVKCRDGFPHCFHYDWSKS